MEDIFCGNGQVCLKCQKCLKFRPNRDILSETYVILNWERFKQFENGGSQWISLKIGSTILPGFTKEIKNFDKENVIKSVRFVLVYLYKTHIYCCIRDMASNNQPAGISKPCMARGAGALGHKA